MTTARPLGSDERTTFTRAGYLSVVLVGFVAAASIAVGHLTGGARWRAIITIAFALGLAVRYWWVIFLLRWPFTVARVALLLSMWAGVGVIAATGGTTRAWVWSFAGVFLIGAATEIYNHATRQWAVTPPAFERSLRADHVRGAAAATVAAVATVISLLAPPRYTTVFVAGVVAIDWLRLAEMVRRHRRFMESAE